MVVATVGKIPVRCGWRRLRADALPKNSQNSTARGSDWAQLESGTFQCTGIMPFRDPLNKERRFLPLRLGDARDKMKRRRKNSHSLAPLTYSTS